MGPHRMGTHRSQTRVANDHPTRNIWKLYVRVDKRDKTTFGERNLNLSYFRRKDPILENIDHGRLTSGPTSASAIHLQLRTVFT